MGTQVKARVLPFGQVSLSEGSWGRPTGRLDVSSPRKPDQDAAGALRLEAGVPRT